jgi:putative phosphoesterase
MKAGIISDTHDHLDNLKKILRIFLEKNVGHIFHAGDFTSPFTLRVMKESRIDFTAIFGNNDGDRLLLSRISEGKIHTQPHKTTLHNKNIILVHEPDIVEELAKSQSFDLIIYGHTHSQETKNTGRTLIVNPGEACGWLTGKATACIIDLQTMEVEAIRL